MVISEYQKKSLLTLTNSESITEIELIQGVWGGYGQLLRIKLAGGNFKSVVLKLINLPKPEQHPKGWNSTLSHQRKLFSYQVESYWYQHYAPLLHSTPCTLPRCFMVEKDEFQHCLVLQDLSECGFPVVKQSCSLIEAQKCITWLAQFHVLHLNHVADGLWAVGSYWHLATRPDELQNLQDSALKKAAPQLDKILTECPFQTLIHGDAKLANFCFSESGENVAAVDFQYVGKGCGMKDLILFISSAVKPEDCALQAPILVDHYFRALKKATLKTAFDGKKLEDAWRPLYCIAWADFQRFIKGWSPGHWKINTYTESLTTTALTKIDALISSAI